MSPDTQKLVREAVEAYRKAPDDPAAQRQLSDATAAFLEDAVAEDAPYDGARP